MVLAAGGWPGWRVFLWVLVCMITARTAAMAFNRLVDWDFDKANPRTADRHRLVTRSSARAMVLISVALFAFACWNLNPLCLLLSPLALFLIFFYSITKRFSSYTHFFLGLALATAPMGAWAAVRGELASPIPWLFALGVFFWVAGFDLIYSTLDADFDRAAGLKSIPASFGVKTALALAPILHAVSVMVLGLAGWLAGLGWPYATAWGLACLALVLEHRWARTGDLTQTNRAFFHANAFVSLILFAGVLGGLALASSP